MINMSFGFFTFSLVPQRTKKPVGLRLPVLAQTNKQTNKKLRARL